MIARLTVQRGTLTEYPLAERTRGGWQNGVTFYPDADVIKVTPLELLPTCICTPAIAGISDGPNVDCPQHGESQGEPTDVQDAEEPDWEWGYRLVGDDGNVYKTGFAYDDPREPTERGKTRVVEENEVHEANAMPRLSFELIRRRKAGPWEPVPATEGDGS